MSELTHDVYEPLSTVARASRIGAIAVGFFVASFGVGEFLYGTDFAGILAEGLAAYLIIPNYADIFYDNNYERPELE